MEGPQEKKTPPERILECRVEEYLPQFRWSGYKFVPSVENWMTAIYSQPPKWLKICKRVVTPRFLNCPIQFAWPLDNSLSKQEEARVDTCRYPALLGRGCSTVPKMEGLVTHP
ncbi:Uncharacterized protein APZ42_014206 [Daphnia magna]|uniref:Uncharacterized protein n=1 Tax=Daphnia magna TaxID=35525 RepID=A0A162Q1Z0_9CRUS|nr:Uncharacterized protein APZ42_014206 [Daphnia magna]